MNNKIKTGYLSLSLVLLLILGCGSNPPGERPAPPWVNEPTRIVDNGYIVYVGTGEEVDPREADISAEGMAIQDMANECSFVPKGARVEDHFSQKLHYTTKSYAKVAVEFTLCDQAQKTLDPMQIRDLASAPFTEQLKKYQEMSNNRDEVVESGIAPPYLAAPPPQGQVVIANNVQFFVVRQYFAYQKEVVILGPPTLYVTNSTESVDFVHRITPIYGHMQTYMVNNPQIRTGNMTWSNISSQARERYPHVFRAAAMKGNGLKPPATPEKSQGRKENPGSRDHRRRRRNFDPTSNN